MVTWTSGRPCNGAASPRPVVAALAGRVLMNGAAKGAVAGPGPAPCLQGLSKVSLRTKWPLKEFALYSLIL